MNSFKKCSNKNCSYKGNLQPISNFYSRKGGLCPWCKDCTKLLDKKWRADNQEHKSDLDKEYSLRKNYGLTLADRQRMLEEQEYKCAICRQPKSYMLHIDHNHKTNKVRALLCYSCNAILGLVQDDISRLEECIKYLTKYQ